MRNLVPQLILEAFGRGQRDGRFTAAALFVDVTGFTPLTEALFRRRRRGAELLSETLAGLFQPMVQQVYARDGFITHFAGDAFTAVFPCLDGEESVENAARRAWQTAVFIQQHLFRNRQGRLFATPYGQFTIGVRVGLALGPVSWHIPGGDGRYTWYFRGEAIHQCARVQKEIQPGEIAATGSFRQALGKAVTAVSLGRRGTSLLSLPVTPLPPAAVRPAPVVSRRDLRPFVPDAILDLTLPADFRHVCPVFISLQGSPPAAAVNHFVTRVLALASAHGGAFSRIEFGDKGGFMALWFGAPLAWEDNVTRAAQCLLALRRETTDIVWRAGMSYGLVWAGFRGAETRWEYTLFGSIVNAAAHIATRAAWGQIWLDETAGRECQPACQIQPLGPVQLKSGRRYLHRLTAARASVAPFYQRKLVGRQAELARLQETVAPLCRGQPGGITLICGEAGAGKSRLLHELRQRLAGTVTWLDAAADAILRQSLNPFRLLLQREFNQTAGRSPARFQAALDSLLAGLAASSAGRAPRLLDQLRRARPFLADLAGLPVSGSLLEQMEPRLRFENRVIALTVWFQARALLSPLVLCLEDIHWLDGDSRRILPRLLRALSGFPAAVLLTSRIKEGSAALPDWLAGLPYTTMRLEALDARETAELGRQLTGAPLAPQTALFLWQRSGGNPYFTEQIILDLQERGQIVLRQGAYALARTSGLELPQTLNTLLIARLDRLPPPVKRVVQTAAALGASFAFPVLARMLPDEEHLPGRIATAEKQSIWKQETDGRYQFNHALLQEAAYQMQPRAHLRELHFQAAQAYEAIYAPDLAAHYSEIAYHYETAFNLGLAKAQTPARRALQKAGEVAATRYETETAISCFSRALALTEEQNIAVQFALLQAREEVYEGRGERERQAADLTAMQRLASRLGWREMAVAAMRQAAYDSFSVAYRQALVHARRAVALVQPHTDSQLSAQARQRLGHVLYRLHRYQAAGSQFRQAIEAAQAAGNLRLQAQCLNGLGMTLDEQGYYDEARRYYRQALALQREINDLAGETVSLNNLGWVDFSTGYTAEARRHYARALEISRRIGHRIGESNGLNNVGMTSLLLGDLVTAERYFHQARQLYRDTNNVRGEANVYTSLALLYLYQKAYETAERYVLQALEMGRELVVRSVQAESQLYLGHIYLARRAYPAAAAAYKESCYLRRALNQPMLQVEPLAGLSRLALAQGNLAAALARVEEILALQAAGHPSRVSELESVDLTCYRVLSQAGDERAEPLLRRAYANLQKRAAKIDDPDLRRMFWQNIPACREIRAIVAGG